MKKKNGSRIAGHKPQDAITYKNAGVNIDVTDGLIVNAKKLIDSTKVKGSVGSVGGFSGFFDPARTGIKDPLLVASTDGVGTKLKIAQLVGKHDTVGMDLVAMSVNDLICTGAKPLFFLDYYASGKVAPCVWTDVIKGIVRGCREAGCVLLGGETAEMPGFYAKGEYDLAGFAVGMVNRKKVIDGTKARPGDVILGLASSGLHSNGYSLVRKIFGANELKKNHELFLRPTTIYVKPILELAERFNVKGIANITGGGFYDNIPRSLPRGTRAIIRKGAWSVPAVFKRIIHKNPMPDKELYRTLNMGIGMVAILSRRDAAKARDMLKRKFKLKSWVIGEVVRGKQGVELVS